MGVPGLQGAQGPQSAAGARQPVWQPFGDVMFDLDRAALRPAEASKLEQLAGFLAQNPTYRVEIEGFADPRGSERHNLKLSEKRVAAVRDALVAAGVAKERILVGAYGELNQKCAEKTEECWQRDRRVEVIVLPTTEPAAVSLQTGNGK